MNDQGAVEAVLTPRTARNMNQKAQSLSLFNPDGSAAIVPQKLEKLPATLYVTGSAIGTVGKTTTTADEPAANTVVAIKFTNGNSANAATVAFNGGTARAIYCSGAASTGAKLALAAGGVALFFFDGTILHQVGAYT